ncbi:MAG: M28 family peptidase [Elusimicrobiales bacterium]
MFNRKHLAYLAYLIAFAAASYIALKLTTVGWNFLAPSYPAGHAPASSPEKLKKTVTDLASDIGPRDVFRNNLDKLRRAEVYIAGRLAAAGYKVEFQEFPAAGTVARNIIASKPGLSAGGGIILVGAHYDTYDNPGADDNASGVACLLDLAEYAAAGRYEKTLVFAAFANEEPPFFKTAGMGSEVYARAARARGDDIRAAVILEMTGYFTERRISQRYPPLIGPFMPGRGNFIAQIANFPSRELAGEIDAAFRAASPLPLRTMALPSAVPGVDFSDHRSFWNTGYRAVMFTDTAFYRNRNYHLDSDLPDTLNYAYMAAFMDGLKGALWKLAGETGQRTAKK